jgi:MFS family permease
MTSDQTIVATAIPKITDEFGSISQVSWYGSAFFITNGSFQSAWGKAYKFFDLKWTFLLSLFIFELGSLICAVAPSSVTLIIGRAIAGIGCAGLATGGFTIIAFLAPPAKRPLYTGFVGIAFGIASVLGPLLGGVFTTSISWRWCFYINLPIGGLSAIIIWFFFKVPPAARPTKASFSEKMLQMDAIGVILMLGSLLAYGLAMQQGGQSRSWESSEIIGLLVGFPVIMAAFIAWEYFLGRRAMLDLDLVSKKTVGISGLFAFFFAGSYFVVIYYLPIYFQSIHGRSALGSGVDNLPLIISATVAALTAAGAVTRFSGAKLWIEVAGAVVALVGAGLLFSLQRDTSTGKWIGYQIVGGLGWGASFQLPIIIAQSAASASDLPSVTAIILCKYHSWCLRNCLVLLG